MSKLKMIPVKIPKEVIWKRTPKEQRYGKRVKMVRRETNDQILHQASLVGNVRIRIAVQIYHAEIHQFVGWKGVHFQREFATVKEAKEFVAKLKSLGEA